MCTPATIRVDNNFAPSQAGITHRAAQDETDVTKAVQEGAG
jgi:hypothetical protein